jgi:Transposase DDE domain
MARRGSHGQKGVHYVLVGREPHLSHRSCRICGGLVWQVASVTRTGPPQYSLYSTLVSVRSGIGYTHGLHGGNAPVDHPQAAAEQRRDEASADQRGLARTGVPDNGQETRVGQAREQFVDLAVASEEQERIPGVECEEAAKGRRARRENADVFRRRSQDRRGQVLDGVGIGFAPVEPQVLMLLEKQRQPVFFRPGTEQRDYPVVRVQRVAVERVANLPVYPPLKGNGQEAKLGYLGHVLMENRHGLIVDAMLTTADGTAERDAALLMMYRRWRKRRQQRRTGSMSVGADKAYDTKDFVETLRAMGVRPHVTQNVNRPGGNAIDSRTVRHGSYQISQKKRPLIEKAFGWMKQTGGLRKTKLRGLRNVAWQFLMTAAAFNLWRLPKIQSAEV